MSCFFLIAFPSFFLEIPAIPRQMIAEFTFVILLFLLIKSTLRTKIKIPLIVLCALLIPLFHYSIAIISLALLIPLLVSKVIGRKLVFASLGVILIAGLAYFPFVEEGAVVNKLHFAWNTI